MALGAVWREQVMMKKYFGWLLPIAVAWAWGLVLKVIPFTETMRWFDPPLLATILVTWSASLVVTVVWYTNNP